MVPQILLHHHCCGSLPALMPVTFLLRCPAQRELKVKDVSKAELLLTRRSRLSGRKACSPEGPQATPSASLPKRAVAESSPLYSVPSVNRQ